MNQASDPLPAQQPVPASATFRSYQPGESIGGKFLVQKYAKGGLGEVYFCYDVKQDYFFALKTFQSRYLADREVRRLFVQEADVWVSLGEHPNIVACSGVIEVNNTPFLLLEWVTDDNSLDLLYDQIHADDPNFPHWLRLDKREAEPSRGTDLQHWLRSGRLDLRLALDFAIDISRGLQHISRRQPGLVHRDLKPSNILITAVPSAKITDFGLAAVVERANLPISTQGDAAQQTLTRVGNVIGTPDYMAPEQWQHGALDARTDIYAVGCILYEMLTGSLPFPPAVDGGASQQMYAALRAAHEHAPPPDLGAAFPASVNRIIQTCLRKEPAGRFANADELLEALSAVYRDLFGQSPEPAAVAPLIPTAAVDEEAEAEIRRASADISAGRYAAAKAALERAVGLHPSHLVALMAYDNLGEVCHRLGRHPEAIAAYTNVIRLVPDRAEAYNNRGVVYDEMKKYDQALADYTRALALKPEYDRPYTNRGNVYIDQQMYAEAVHEFTQAIRINPDNAEAYSGRGFAYSYLHRHEEALRDSTQAIHLTRGYSPRAYATRGLVYAELLHQYEQAVADFSRAIELDPQRADPLNVEVFINRALCFGELGRHEQALQGLTEAITLDPSCAEAFNTRANIYHTLGRIDEALADYLHAVDLSPDFAVAHYNIGSLHAQRKEWRKALPYFARAAQLGLLDGKQALLVVQQELGLADKAKADPNQVMFRQFYEAGSPNDMRELAVKIKPLAGAEFVRYAAQRAEQADRPEERQHIQERLAWLQRIIDAAGKEVRIVFYPSHEAESGAFYLAAGQSGASGGFARSDSTFTEGASSAAGVYGAMSFAGLDEALQWANSPPRNWRVVNMALFTSSLVLSRRLVVRVTEIRPSSILHESARFRRRSGEEVSQVTVKFDLLEWEPPTEEPPPIGGCHILIDQEVMQRVAARRLYGLGALVGRSLLLACDDPDDLFRPLRLLEIL